MLKVELFYFKYSNDSISHDHWANSATKISWSIHSSSHYQIADSVTGHIYTIPDHVAGCSTLNHLLQEWMKSGLHALLTEFSFS